MRTTAARFLTPMAILALILVCGEARAADGRSKGGKDSKDSKDRKSSRRGRKLTPAQIKKLKERIAKMRGSGGAKGAGSAANVSALYKEAEAAYKAEKFASAYEYYVDIAACKEVKGASGYAAKARARLLELEKAADDKLEEAKLARIQGKGAESLEIVKVLLEKYPYTEAAAGANDLLVMLSSNPRVAAAVALVKAEELDKAARYPEAAKAYSEIMVKYPGSVQALKSKLRLKAMKADEEIAKAIKDSAKSAADVECPRMLIMARNYAMNRMYPQARGLYRKLIKKYPKSDYAAQAGEALKEIEEEEKKVAQSGNKEDGSKKRGNKKQ